MDENAHWKKDERTLWKDMEPTIPDPRPKIDPYGYSFVPPPPPVYSYRRQNPVAFYIICMVIVISGIIEIVGGYFLIQLKPLQKTIVQHVAITPFPTKILTATLTPVQPMNPNYTATDLFNVFRKAGLVRPGAVAQGPITVWSWSADNYFVATHSTSSVSWSDDSGCTGYCSPAALGLWVYATGIDAQHAADQIGSDEHTVGSIPMLGIPSIYVGGRCVFLSNDSQQTNELYVQLMHTYCI